MTARPFAAPLDLGKVRLRNRFVSAPMERNYCEVDGTMTDEYIAYLERRAAGGAALVFTEASYVRADGKGRVRQMGVDVDERIPGIAKMAEAIHAQGALVASNSITAAAPRRVPSADSSLSHRHRSRARWSAAKCPSNSTATTSSTSSNASVRPPRAVSRPGST